MEETTNLNEATGIERAIRSMEPKVATIDISPWFAGQLKEKFQLKMTFRRLNVYEVKAASRKALLLRVAFSTDVGRNCYCCGMPLTTEISRATGIGPVCAEHHGVPRKSLDDAKTTIEFMNTLADTFGTFEAWMPKKCILRSNADLDALAPAPVKQPEPQIQLTGNQVQLAEWFARKNNLPVVLDITARKAETEKWVLLVVQAGAGWQQGQAVVREVGVPKSCIVAGDINSVPYVGRGRR